MRITRLGANYDMDVQILRIVGGAPKSLLPGETYKVVYPSSRRKLAKANPALYAALKRVRSQDVATVIFTATTDSSRTCWSTGISTGCTGWDEEHEYELIAVSAPTGICLQGNKQRVHFEWTAHDLRLVACVLSAGSTSSVVALWSDAPMRAVRSVTANLARAGTTTLIASTAGGAAPDTTGDFVMTKATGEMKAGRYRLGGCIDILDDGKGCREFPTRVVTYRPR